MKWQAPALGIGALSTFLAYLSTSTGTPQSPQTQSTEDNRTALKNITLKIVSTGIAAMLAFVATEEFFFHEMASYNSIGGDKMFLGHILDKLYHIPRYSAH